MSSREILRLLVRSTGFDIATRPTAKRVTRGLVPITSVEPLLRRSILRRTFQITISECTSFHGRPFVVGSGNPLVETCVQLVRDGSLSYVDSALFEEHASFRPENMQELLLPGETREMKPLNDWPVDRRLFRYVWDIDRRGLSDALAGERPTRHNYYFGPMGLSEGEKEFERLCRVWHSIEKRGYQREEAGPITGYFVADPPKFRFVIGSGNHRVAVLAALGCATIDVSLHSHPAIVSRRALSRWTIQRGGPFAPETAEALLASLLGERAA